MSRQSEEVLLIVNNVKNKKVDGVLYMMGERLAWMQPSKNSFSYSHAYADIKCKLLTINLFFQLHIDIIILITLIPWYFKR